MNVSTASWAPADEAFSSTAWGALPTPMSLSFTTAATASVIVLADVSRVQGADASTNAEFRIVVDGAVVAQTNTGHSSLMDYHQVAVHAVAA